MYRKPLEGYIVGILDNIHCPSLQTGCVEDHIHILFSLSKTITIADAIETIKTSSSRWMKTQSPSLENFYWQSGYGAFSVSQSNVAAVREYILGQEEHHKRLSFQDEYRTFLKRHGMECDERYVWD